MKSRVFPLFFIALFVASFLVPAESSAQNVGDIYRAARTAFTNGDFETAKNLLDQVLRTEPTYVPARALRAQVQQQLDVRGAGDALKKKCASVIIPQINFQDVELKLALEALAVATSDATKKKFRPNFILSGGEEVGSRKVTLQLRRAPLSTILEYIGKITDVTFRYERFAVVGVPHVAAAAPAVAPEPTVPAIVPENPFEK